MKFEIPGRLPGFNEIIAAAKAGRGKYQPYAMMKEEHTGMIALYARKLPRFNKASITITWYEPNAKRDIDNIAGGGTKFILDGLVMAGKIQDDRQKYVKSIEHRFEIDRKNPRIEVEISEAI